VIERIHNTMDEQKSRIDSFDVSLGQSPRNGIPKKPLEPWNVLVCSDLGFSSLAPRQVHISEWNEFVSSCAVMVSGTCENKMSNDGKSVFVEFSVSSLKDFKDDAIIRTVQPWASYTKAIAILEQTASGMISLRDAAAAIKKAGLPGGDESRVLRLLNAPSPTQGSTVSAYPAPATGAKLDTLLSMIDLPGATTAATGPAEATDALITSIVGSQAAVDNQAVLGYANDLRERLDDQLGLIRQQPFFASRASSWNALMTLAKVIGRNKDIRLRVVSAPYHDCAEAIPGIMASCRDLGFSPDLVVWDYDVTLSNADIDRMEKVAENAEQANSVVVMSLSMLDPLFVDLDKRDSIRDALQEVRLLPYQRLRAKTGSRCLCLCGPAMGGDAGHCSWFVATRWAELLLSEQNPFGVKESRMPPESVYPSQNVFRYDYAPAVVDEARAMGFSLFGKKPVAAKTDRLSSLIVPENAAPGYSLFMFNLLVNRVVRLCGIYPRGEGSSKSIDDRAVAMNESIRRELSAYGVITNGEQVSVVVQEGSTIRVEVDSEVTMSGYPLRLSFSF
jgi:predicted component of type VI protein secretion system